MCRFLLAVVVLGACTTSESADESPQVQTKARSSEAACASNERLVTDACTELGPDDGCVDVDDVCIALCDGLTTCTETGGLRATSPWPVAPNGYCVSCDVP